MFCFTVVAAARADFLAQELCDVEQHEDTRGEVVPPVNRIRSRRHSLWLHNSPPSVTIVQIPPVKRPSGVYAAAVAPYASCYG